MARFVEKFGGTSVADARKLYMAARRLAADYRAGHEVIGVLSARAGETDALLARAREVNPDCGGQELDLLLAAGEQMNVALCAIALRRLDVPAVALCGWQAGIQTDRVFGCARVQRVDTARIEQALAEKKLVLVAGFQGLSPQGEITTLGRGGSDTTAVALAAWLKADKCRIFTDVDGVYDRDPRSYPDAIKYERLSYDQMLLLARGGARVLHDRCIELAKQQAVQIEVCSAFRDLPGTLVGG